jgi:hypothetical protein
MLPAVLVPVLELAELEGLVLRVVVNHVVVVVVLEAVQE